MLQHMDSFHWIRTLRLQSGNGEPTTNPHLASIISLLARSEPHLDLSFYTNGVLLDRNNLIPTLIDNAVGWINVSINAATREQWSELCGADHFLSVCSNLKNLLASKKQRRSYSPLVYGSIVLTCQSASELPRMLELCRELGVDRLTAIPFYAPGYKRPDHYDIEDAYHYIGIDYNRIYYQTIRTAEDYRISIELPLPQVNKSAAFGVEKRILHDFAKIEQNGRRLSTLLSDFIYPTPDMQQCPSLWRLAAITNTTRGHKAADQTHFLYPCLGALCSVDFSEHLPFRFDGDSNLRSLWLHPLLQYLRESQIHQGACAVCDMCRSRDSRDPQSFQQMSDLIKQFCIEHGI